MTIVIRNISHLDKSNIFQLIEALNQKDQLSYSLTEEWFEHVLNEAGEDMFVATQAEQIIGLATCMIHPVDETQAVVNIMVEPKHRSQGCGQRLYIQMLEHAQKKQIQQL